MAAFFGSLLGSLSGRVSGPSSSSSSPAQAQAQIQQNVPPPAQVEAAAEQLSTDQIESILERILSEMMDNQLQFLLNPKEEKYMAGSRLWGKILVATVVGYLRKNRDYFASRKAKDAQSALLSLFQQQARWLRGDLSRTVDDIRSTLRDFASLYCKTLENTRGKSHFYSRSSTKDQASRIQSECRNNIVGEWDAYSFQLYAMAEAVYRKRTRFPLEPQLVYIRQRFLHPLVCSLLFVTGEYGEKRFPRCFARRRGGRGHPRRHPHHSRHSIQSSSSRHG